MGSDALLGVEIGLALEHGRAEAAVAVAGEPKPAADVKAHPVGAAEVALMEPKPAVDTPVVRPKALHRSIRSAEGADSPAMATEL
jgi:hypothetical protein